MNFPLHVVILEHCRDISESMAALINLWGHKVRCAETVGETLRIHQEFRSDVIFVNIDITGLRCLDFVQEIRGTDSPAKPLLTAISGYSYRDCCHRFRAVDVGFDYQLTKPIDPNSLKSLLTFYQGALRREPARRNSPVITPDLNRV